MQRIKKAYAENGDLKIIPDTPPLDGSENWDQGRGAYYELDNDPSTGDPLALDIDREQDNYFKNVISKNIKHWQENSYPIWFNDIKYPKNAIVKYTNGNIYASKVDNNTALPTNTTNWTIYDPSSLDGQLDGQFVKLTEDQTVAGVKTFTSSPIVPTPTTDTQAANKKYVDDINSNIQTLPIGTILNGYTIFGNCIVAFGGEFNRADYPKLWAYLQANPSLVKTQAQWTTESTANGGICGFYSSGNGTTTFRVPNLDKAFLRPDSRSVGSYQGDAIRNITGRANSDLVRFEIGPTDGAFRAEADVNRPRPSSATSAFTSGFNFDASRVVPTANENRPKNIAVLPLIVAK